MHLILLDCDIYYPSCIAFCNAFLDENENREQLIQDFIENAKKYIDIQELTPEILRAFISRIEAVSYTHLDVYKRQVVLWTREDAYFRSAALFACESAA